jgi:hypothetical protein
VKYRNFLSQSWIARITVSLISLTLLSFPSPAVAAPACVLNTDYTKDTSSVSGYTILKFTKTGSCSFRNTEAITSVDYLVVGGGGGGGAHVGGGGGGGGVIQGTTSIAGLGAIPVTVGSGGTGAWINQSAWQTYGSNGGYSSLNGLIAYGGGVGGIWNTVAPGNGSNVVGSAGGSGQVYNSYVGTSGQGNNGGAGNNVQPHAAGGGGGAGQAGGNGTQTDNSNGTGGKGGDGVQVNIDGTPTYYGGGGGGGVHGNNNNSVYTGGAGGLGGGGAGSSHSGSYYVSPRQPANYGTSGTANTGGGGGGAGGGMLYVENKAGNGGSGIVVIKYANTNVSPGENDFAISTKNTKFFYAPSSSDIMPGTLSTLSVEAWVKPSSTCDGSYYCSILAVNGSLLLDIYQGKITYIIGSGSAWCDGSVVTTLPKALVPSGRWHHIALIRNSATVKIYLNGYLVSNLGSSCGITTQTASSSTQFGVGYRQDQDQYFYGNIDDVRIWTTDRSANIADDMHSNETGTNGLIGYWNFNEGSGEAAFNQVPNSKSETDLIAYGSAKSSIWDSTSISTSTISGPYTVRTFFRSYITAAGGWRIPAGVNSVSSVVVAGGGGGGAESDDTGWFGGGGGAGGYQFITHSGLSQNLAPVIIGAGGRGGEQVSRSANSISLPTNGQNSQFMNTISIGGGAGGVSFTSGRINGSSGGSGGGGATYSGSGGASSAGQGNIGGSAASYCCAGGGGGGAGSAGGTGTATTVSGARGGAAGNGVLNPLYISGTSPQYLAAGGAAGSTASIGSTGLMGGTAAFTNANTNTGSGGGGGGSYSSVAANADKAGGQGGSGIVIVRWITASVPSYTKPVNANLNVGMIETFTVNVATDSATAQLTRTFKWESSTAGASGPWTLLKQGTGAANAAFSWVPSDTSTSGSNHLYRLTVTDSDTAGLFITDSSTAYATINLALGISGSNSIGKSINSTTDETFTVTNGTPTYRYSLSPTISGITLDTRSAGFPVIRFAETVTVGTYLETLTVTDSVSASIDFPITIKVSGPPTLSNASEVVTNGQVFHIDSGNSGSYTPGTAASGTTGIRDISGGKNTVTVNGSALAYSDDYGGTLTLSSANSNYLQFTKRSTLTSWTVEGFVNITAAPAGVTCVATNQYTTSQINYALCIDAGMTWYSGFHNGLWTYKRTGNVLSTNTWYHLVGTYSADSGVQLYLDGQLVTNISDSAVSAGTTPPAGDTQIVYIGRRWDANTYLPMKIGAVRIYDTALTSAQVQQNYNATRIRFTANNLNQLKPTQKHNTTTVETFTVTSGGDTKTVTYAVGNRTGIEWTTPDTSTVKLTVKPDLVVGTYYDTVTVTDNFSSSTILPVKITINKGDQAKISIGQYNAFPGISTYPINVTGGSGTGSLTRTITDSGTAQCVLSGGMFLTATRVGKCSVRVVKDTDANFLAETGTATIFWVQWNDAYATRVASTPTEIVLQHETQIIRHSYETLTVTSYTDTATVPNTITSARPGQTIRILGLGFDSSDNSSQATFTDNEYADRTALTNDYIQVVVPSGAVTGPVTVDTLKGNAVGPTLTILSP